MFERSIADMARAADSMAVAGGVDELRASVEDEISLLVDESGASFAYLRISVLPLVPPLVFPCRAARNRTIELSDSVTQTAELRRAEAGDRVEVRAGEGQLGSVLLRHSLEGAWLRASGRSLLGSNHALFAFRSAPPKVSGRDWANLGVRINVLVGSACHRLIDNPWDEIGAALSEHHKAAHVRLALADRLSEGDIEVVQLLLAGHRVRTIAELLYISPHTVRNRMKRVFRVMGVRSQAELVTMVRSIAATPPATS